MMKKLLENIYIYLYSRLYSFIMKTAHKYHWHYAPPSYPEGDTHLCCHWCGFRQTIKKNPYKNRLSLEGMDIPQQCEKK